jgi:DNA-directed RNA polymerase specialized sigma24 family protein
VSERKIEPRAVSPAVPSGLTLALEAARRRAGTFEEAVLPLWPALVRRLALVLGDTDGAEDVAQEA